MLYIEQQRHGRRCRSKKYYNKKMIKIKIFFNNLNISYLIDLNWIYNQKSRDHIIILEEDYKKYRQAIEEAARLQVEQLTI